MDDIPAKEKKDVQITGNKELPVTTDNEKIETTTPTLYPDVDYVNRMLP